MPSASGSITASIRRRGGLDQAQLRPVGGLAHELGVDGDEGLALQPRAEGREFGGGGDRRHRLAIAPRAARVCKTCAPRRPNVPSRAESSRPMTDRRNGLTYAEAGVDIDAGDALVEAIKPLAKATRRPGADAALGGFGALFDLKAAGYDDPLLVTTTDGVGTKLKIAIETGLHDTRRHRSGGHVRQRPAGPGRRAAAVPRLFRHRQAGRGRRRRAWSPASPRAAGWPAPRWSAARRPRCRACTPAATTTWPASASARWTAAAVLPRLDEPARRRPDDRPRPPPARTPTAIR